MVETSFQVGDLVEATKGESVIRGRVKEYHALGDLYIYDGYNTSPIEDLLESGFTITVTEPAAPVEAKPCQCHQSHANITPTHPGHCCFLRLNSTCHSDEVAAWEAERAETPPAPQVVVPSGLPTREGIYFDGTYRWELFDGDWEPIHAPSGMPSTPDVTLLRAFVSEEWRPLAPIDFPDSQPAVVVPTEDGLYIPAISAREMAFPNVFIRISGEFYINTTSRGAEPITAKEIAELYDLTTDGSTPFRFVRLVPEVTEV